MSHASYGGGALWLSAIRQVAGGKIVVGGHQHRRDTGTGMIESLRFLDDGAPDRSFNGTGSAPYAPCWCSVFNGDIYGVHRIDDGGKLLFPAGPGPGSRGGK